MTSPDRPAPGEDIAKGSDAHAARASGGEPGDPDQRDPTGHAPDSAGLTAEEDAPEPLEPPD